MDSVKAERIRIQIDHLKIKYEYELKLKEAKYKTDMRKLELALLDIVGHVDE